MRTTGCAAAPGSSIVLPDMSGIQGGSSGSAMPASPMVISSQPPGDSQTPGTTYFQVTDAGVVVYSVSSDGTPVVVSDISASLTCSVECQYKQGTATLCGFDEFIASSPPRKYRQMATSGNYVEVVYPNSTCTGTSPGCLNCADASSTITLGNSGGSIPMTGIVDNSEGTYNGSGTLSFSCSSGGWHDDGGTPFATRRYVDGEGHVIVEEVQARIIVGIGGLNCDSGTCARLQARGVGFAEWIDLDVVCVKPPPSLVSGAQHIWDKTETYDASTCLASTDDQSTAVSYGLSTCSCGLDTGTSIPFPCTTNPGACYGSYVSAIDTSTSRTWSGNGCVAVSGGHSATHSGTSITSLLSDEDTEEDAIARSADGLPWLVGPECLGSYKDERTTGFSFDYRVIRYRILCDGMDEGSHYQVTGIIGQREIGSTGPYVESGRDTFDITAEGRSEYTPWTEVGIFSGMETSIIGCSIEKL